MKLGNGTNDFPALPGSCAWDTQEFYSVPISNTANTQSSS